MNEKVKKILAVIVFIIIIIFIFKPEIITNFFKKINLNIGNVDTSNNFFYSSESKDPVITNNGQRYVYSDIKPTITLLPPSIINIPPIIIGSIISTKYANEDYYKYYRIFSGTERATIITREMMGIEYDKLKPEVIKDLETNDNIFEWKYDDKCYIPQNYRPETDDYETNRDGTISDSYIILGKCNSKNAQYKMINGYIQHIASNKYLTASQDIPILEGTRKDNNLYLVSLQEIKITMKNDKNEDQEITVPEVFVLGNYDIPKMQFIYEDNKIKHKSSSYGTRDTHVCVTPFCVTSQTITNNCEENKIYLSLAKCKNLP
jgi:hypothetical protein